MTNLQRVINNYIEYFKEKENLVGKNIEEIEEILNSEKYDELIDKIYEYYNSRVPSNGEKKERLSIEYYLSADEQINKFWIQLLGENLTDEIRSKLKLPVQT
jgi:hypothetical protein